MDYLACLLRRRWFVGHSTPPTFDDCHPRISAAKRPRHTPVTARTSQHQGCSAAQYTGDHHGRPVPDSASRYLFHAGGQHRLPRPAIRTRRYPNFSRSRYRRRRLQRLQRALRSLSPTRADHRRPLPSRRGCCQPRPSQTRTSGFPASGSSRASFAHGTAYWWTIVAEGSGCRASMVRKRDHGRLLCRPRRLSHFFHIRTSW
jgi:hypothetical protein